MYKRWTDTACTRIIYTTPGKTKEALFIVSGDRTYTPQPFPTHHFAHSFTLPHPAPLFTSLHLLSLHCPFRMSGAIPLPPSYAFLARTETTWTLFTFYRWELYVLCAMFINESVMGNRFPYVLPPLWYLKSRQCKYKCASYILWLSQSALENI